MSALVIALAGTGIAGSSSTFGGGDAFGTLRGDTSGGVTRRGCADARRGLVFYVRRTNEHRSAMGAARIHPQPSTRACAYTAWLADLWRHRAKMARRALTRYLAIQRQHHRYHYAWRVWLPDKWQRIGACETGYGRRPGQWTWNSGMYQGAFGFHRSSWDAFVSYADPKAGPYPSEAYLATPRQQYEVALAIYRRYGFSGWGCRGA